MNKEEFIKKIKEINATVPNEYFFLEYNKCVCDILEENQELKKQLEEKNNKLNSVLDYIDSNIFIEQFENVGNENNVRKEIIKRITNDKEVE